ncbi:MAG: S8 family peptidase [Anaerolineae bacterium]
MAQDPSNEPPPSPAMPEFVPGEIIVKFRPEVSRLARQNSLSAQGLDALEISAQGEVLRLQVEPGQEAKVMADLLAGGQVEYASPNYYVYAMGDPNDPGYSAQWNLKNVGQTGGLVDADIDAPEAWDIHTGSNNTTIAIVDTGVDLDHPDLQAKIVAGYDFVNNDAVPDDDAGHGTHVAGIAAAIGNNGIGVAGVSWGAKIMPVKVLNASGNGTTLGVAKGIDFAVANGAKVINLSLGAPGTSYPCTGFEVVRDAMQRALDSGRLVIVASGNSNTAVSCPGAYDQAMAVGSTTDMDTRSSTSNYGPQLDIAAPGNIIYSTVPGGSYNYLSGTSMATPHVAGLAALIWSFVPGLSNSQVRSIIQNTADDLGPAGWDQEYGYGRINANCALTVAAFQSAPSQVFLFVDDNTASASQNFFISNTCLTWNVSIPPEATWLNTAPITTGALTRIALTANRPAGYGTYSTTVTATGATASGVSLAPIVTQVTLFYLHETHTYHMPLIFKN